jgi:hypothetical protein
MKRLSKVEMKKITGGSEALLGGGGGGTCAIYLPPGTGTGTPGNPTQFGGAGIQFSSMTYVNGTQTFYGLSAADAQAQAVGKGTHWCCNSCASASWYNP